MKRLFQIGTLLALAVLASACGNKGPLVKPEPAKSEAGTGR